MNPQRRKDLLSLLGRTLLALGAATLALLICELLVWLSFDRLFHETFFAYDAELGFRVRPHAVWAGHQTNRFGFNDIEHSLEKPPDTYRILLLGDSFSWIGGYERSYPTLLEARFADAPAPDQPKVEVINAGFPGIHTGQEQIIMERYGLRYDPDLVLVAFYTGNDIYDFSPRDRMIAVGDTLVPSWGGAEGERTFLGQPITGHGRLYLLGKQFKAKRELERGRASAGREDDSGDVDEPGVEDAPETDAASAAPPYDPFTLDGADYSLSDWYRSLMLEHIRVARPAEQDTAFVEHRALVVKALTAMRDQLEPMDIEMGLVLIPDEYQVNDRVMEQLRQSAAGSDSLTGFDPAEPQRWIQTEAAKLQIPVLDLLPAFRAEMERSGRGLYIPNDSHWNAAGCRLAADEVFAAVGRGLW
jgi:hypothetical protein